MSYRNSSPTLAVKTQMFSHKTKTLVPGPRLI